MKKNMGIIDRGLRILAAIVVIVLYFTNVISGIVAIIGLVIAGAFILTGFMGSCPAYLPFGIDTREKKTKTG